MTRDTQLQSFRIDEHHSVWIEVRDLPAATGGADDLELVARPQSRPERLLQEALAQVRPAAAAVFETLRELNTPSQIELEFTIGFSGQVGAFIANAGTSGEFKVKLTWDNARPAPLPASTPAAPPA